MTRVKIGLFFFFKFRLFSENGTLRRLFLYQEYVSDLSPNDIIASFVRLYPHKNFVFIRFLNSNDEHRHTKTSEQTDG